MLPGTERTRLLALPQFPEDDEARHELLANLAADEIVEGQVPCWGFVAEGELDDGGDVVVVVYGARKHAPHLTAAVKLDDGTLGRVPPGRRARPDRPCPTCTRCSTPWTSCPPVRPRPTACRGCAARRTTRSPGGLPMFGGE